MSDSPSLRIFVVENHADTLKWLKLYLEQHGHTVLTARTLSEAVELFPTSECRVLISDIGLPDGNGWELLQRLKPSKDVFAIAMSGFGMNADSARSRSVGYRYHLLKPFKVSELSALLKEAPASLSADAATETPRPEPELHAKTTSQRGEVD